MEFPPLDPTDYIRLGMRKYKAAWYKFTKSKYHWKAAKDREFCLSVLDEKRLAVIGLQQPWTKSYDMYSSWRWSDGTMDRWDQTWIYTKGAGWAKSTPMPKRQATSGYIIMRSGNCGRSMTAAECEAAVFGMGLEWLDPDGVSEEKSSSYPPYCYLYNGKTIWFNKAYEDDDEDEWTKCSKQHPCVCRTNTNKNTRGECCYCCTMMD